MSFRSWLNCLWLDHVDEIVGVTGRNPVYTDKDFFNKYKWWLRREYKHFKENMK